MKNIQPGMNLQKQISKARAAIDAAFNEGNREKASYIRHLAEEMIKSAEQGQPQPWSNYEPMIQEEFG